MNPLISVIIPVYKVEKYIHQCIESVLDQNYRNFEIILVNDGSPDNCPAICDEFALKDKRVNVIHKKNGGLSDARNFGINASKGNYLLFLDSDDYWKDNNFLLNISKLILFDDEIEVINYGVIKYFPLSDQYLPDKRNFSLVKNHDENNREYIKKMLKNDLFIASACNKCIKRKFVLENDLFFEKGLRSEDMAWCGNILYLMPLMTCVDLQPYVYRQEREGSITSNVDARHLADIVRMIDTALKKGNHLNLEDKYYYLSFYAVQYLTLLFNLKMAKGQKSLDLSREVHKLRSILNNDLNPKVDKANKFRKIFGYNIMSLVLRLYVLKIKI